MERVWHVDLAEETAAGLCDDKLAAANAPADVDEILGFEFLHPGLLLCLMSEFNRVPTGLDGFDFAPDTRFTANAWRETTDTFAPAIASFCSLLYTT